MQSVGLVLLSLVFLAHRGQAILPIVVYPGLNGTCNTASTKALIDQLYSVFPSVHVHCIRPSSSPLEGFYSVFSNASDQMAYVCQTLRHDPRLQGGFNAIGLSQGGLMMRGYVEMCNNPPVRNLITLGAPHGGVNVIPGCNASYMQSLVRRIEERISTLGFLPNRLLCRVLRSTVHSAIYTEVLQQLFMPAQYFRDPKRLQDYREANTFLARINNEFSPRNATYRRNMQSLRHLVLYRYDRDQLVQPDYSPWFAYSKVKGDFNITTVPAYKGDWIGLRKLYQSGRLRLITIKGDHPNIPADLVRTSLSPFLNITV